MPSLYLVVFGLIVALSIITLFKKKWDSVFYYIGIVVLTLFLCLRFGQGTDYPSYWSIYQQAEKALEPSVGFWKYWRMTGGEIGWQMLMVMFKALHMDFRIVVAFISVVMMVSMHKAIVRFCPNYKTLALMILYPTIYLTYYFSGLRQGLVMSLFYGVLLGLLLDKKFFQYIIGVLLLTMIHKASILYLIVPIVLCLKKRTFIIGTIVSIVFSVGIIFEPTRNIVIQFAGYFGRAGSYFGIVNISLFSMLERTAMMAVVLFLFWRSDQNTSEQNEITNALMKVYYVGFLIYIGLCTSPLVASRLAIMFKMTEIILIPVLLEKAESLVRNACVFILCGMMGFMSYKNLNSYVVQGNYHQGISGWNFPYVTVFDYEKILDYREGFVYEPFDFEEEKLIRAKEF